jgi:hypothetical protein
VGLDEELFEAVWVGDAAKVSKLLRRGANPNAKEDGSTPLHLAVLKEHADIAKLLLEHGADVNAKDKYGGTPLHRAVLTEDADVVTLLLEHGADVNAKDKYGGTPLHLAAAKGHADIARLLLEHGADPSIKDNEGSTPLDIARRKGYAVVARVIEEFVKEKSGKVEVAVTPAEAIALQEPVYAVPSIVSVDCSELYAGEWGRLLVRVRGSGTASLSLEGDVDWINPEVVELSGEGVVEVPVKPRAAGEVPVKVCVESSGSKSSKIVWLKVVEKAGRCPNCGAQVEPGAKYCWKCGTKLR